MKILSVFSFFLFFGALFIADPLFAQEDEIESGEVVGGDLSSDKEDSQVIYQKRNQPRVDLDALRKEFVPPPKVEEIPQFHSASHWSRFTGGLWGSYSNVAATRPLFKMSQDTILLKSGSERAWGFGGQLDFATELLTSQALRFRFGILHSNITPQSKTISKYPSASFENKANIFHLSGVQRFHILHTEETGHLWGGMGLQMNYVYSSSRIRTTGSPRSRLEHSYLFNLIFAMGTDIPLTDLEDISIEFQYLPTKSLAFLIGFRSSL